jgi:hypothetical protein
MSAIPTSSNLPPALVALFATLVACGPSQSVSRVTPDTTRTDARPPVTDATPADAASPDAAAPPDAAVADLAPAPDSPPDGAIEDAAFTAADVATADATADAATADAATADAALAPDRAPDTTPDSPLDRPGPWLMVTHAPAGPLTDLSAPGTLDWIHFGYQGSTRRNRKVGVPARLNMSPVGEVQLYSYDDRPVRFSWRDGTPDTQVTATADGISIGEVVNAGFEIRVMNPSARPATVRLYVGAWNARARLTARLGDGGPPVSMYTDNTLAASAPGQDRVYTIVFRPADPGTPAGSVQPLILRWTLDAVSATYGNVTIQAVTLTE